MEGHAAVVATLLAKGALVDKADNEGSAPLHAAAAMGHEAVVEKLLAHGAQTAQRVGIDPDFFRFDPLF